MSLIVKVPQTTKLFGQSVFSKRRGVSIQQAQQAGIELNLVDDLGNNLDLTNFGFPAAGNNPNFTISCNLMEATGINGIAGQVAGIVIDPTSGLVQFDLPSAVFAVPGVYVAEVGALNLGNLITSNTIYLLVERGTFTIPGSSTNPNASALPTLAEIRLGLRDAPEINRLIDQYEFDISDIGEALLRAVNYVNEAQPPIDYIWTTNNFPQRYYWIKGTTVYLYQMAADWFRRTHLPYQAGGVSVDDLNKAEVYMNAANAAEQAWTKWVTMYKVSINMNNAFHTVGSPYGYTYY